MNIEELYSIFLQFASVTTDSRNIRQGDIFFALKGDHFDGNKFATDAIAKGAACAVVDDALLKNQEKCFWVEDVLTTLQELALHHRRQLSVPVLAITGSNGKTTTKELIAAVLSKKYTVCFTQGNLNNHIGVPLTLLSIKESDQFAVIEMGANHPGEIAALCRIAEPGYGMVTNIGKAHLEGFGSYEGVIRTKSEMYDFLRLYSRPCFINGNDQLLLKKAAGLEMVRYGKDSQAGLQGEIASNDFFITVKALFPKGWLYLKSKLIGSYNADNILAAACIGQYFGVDPLLIQQAISEYQPSNNRSQLMSKRTNQIIMDAYNANPTSMSAALTNLFAMKAANKMVILGDMLELGDVSFAEHQTIADMAVNDDSIQKIFLVGAHFGEVANHTKIKKFGNAELLSDYLYQQKPIENNLILIKGSRGIRLEKVLGAL